MDINPTFHPVTMTKDDLERVVAHPEEASPEQLLGAYAILSLQAERANERLKGITKAKDRIPFSDFQSALCGCDCASINNSIFVYPEETSCEELMYDRKAMNDPSNKTESARFRERRDVLKPELIKAAIKDGSFPPQFKGAVITATSTHLIVGEITK